MIQAIDSDVGLEDGSKDFDGQILKSHDVLSPGNSLLEVRRNFRNFYRHVYISEDWKLDSNVVQGDSSEESRCSGSEV